MGSHEHLFLQWNQSQLHGYNQYSMTREAFRDVSRWLIAPDMHFQAMGAWVNAVFILIEAGRSIP